MSKEEFNETNEILYGKKNAQSVPAGRSSGDDLTDEILYGKRKTKIDGEPAATEKTGGEELMDEILYGKKKPKKSEPAEPAVEGETPPKKSKKFDRDEYFGL